MKLAAQAPPTGQGLNQDDTNKPTFWKRQSQYLGKAAQSLFAHELQQHRLMITFKQLPKLCNVFPVSILWNRSLVRTNYMLVSQSYGDNICIAWTLICTSQLTIFWLLCCEEERVEYWEGFNVSPSPKEQIHMCCHIVEITDLRLHLVTTFNKRAKQPSSSFCYPISQEYFHYETWVYMCCRIRARWGNCMKRHRNCDIG